ncbi:MAG TPA: triacylglycerol lipase [Kofleriaceae bacterium]|jgi:triacylglycerol lipase|nr:triacylglycerol lipase [Kofleriaceae bacterium]
MSKVLVSSLGLALAVTGASVLSSCAMAGDGADQTAAAPEAASTFTQTRYPIVLAHGLTGFRQLFGVVDYFNGIPSDLQSGGARVFVTQVSAVASATERGEQLLQQIETIVATTGAGKVNLIGHSEGGLDARYVMGVRPDLIASLTTVAAPHLGADLADFLAANLAGNGFNQTVLSVFGNTLGTIIDLLTGMPSQQDAIGALQSLSSAGAAGFNRQFPAGLAATRCGATPSAVNGIQLFSWAGSSQLTNVLDLSDPALGLTSLVYSEANDGLVGRCSAHFGKVIRDDFRMNHLDEVNQLFGLTSVFETSPVSVFRSHANRLKNAGL